MEMVQNRTHKAALTKDFYVPKEVMVQPFKKSRS